MIAALRKWLGLCNHSWEQVDEHRVWMGGKHPAYIDYILRCKHCGNLKKVRT